MDLIKGFILLNPSLSSHISPFVGNVSHHLQRAQRLHCVLAGDALAPITTDSFIISWLDSSCVIKLSMMPMALRKLQLTQKSRTHLHSPCGYLRSTKPSRDYPWHFNSSSDFFHTVCEETCDWSST